MRPSPTNITLPYFSRRTLSSASLSSGSSPPFAVSTPSALPTSAAVSETSPVNIAVAMPMLFSDFTASAEVFFTSSETRITPSTLPSTATYTDVPAAVCGSSGTSAPFSCMSFMLPQSTAFAPTSASTPLPAISDERSGSESRISFARQ